MVVFVFWKLKQMPCHSWNPRVYVAQQLDFWLAAAVVCTVTLRANQSGYFVWPSKTQPFGLVRQKLQQCHLLTLFDHALVHTCSNYSLNLNNSFLIHFNSKNCGIFCIKLMKMSSIWLWILIIFPLAGFLMMIIFLTCVHEWYLVPFSLWNCHIASIAFEIFCGKTRHIDLHFHIKFVDFPFVVW